MTYQPNKIKKWIFWFAVAGVLLFVMATVLGGVFMDGYSHVRQLISESYANGTEYGPLLRWAGYIPSGILITLFAFLAPLVLPKSRLVALGFWGVGIFYGIGTIMVAFFPCDTGCNPEFIDPSISQIVHTVIGGLTYITVPLSLLLVGLGSSSKMRIISLASGVLAYCFVVLLFKDPTGPYIGVYQRVAEACILSWLLFVAFYIKKL
ncbi:hypothetical protein KCTC52924_00741 [Arenibacter antarcticus]|uniref:DUF998 domain-containing protein n=1 Tax=Arenibacter antarcticus TaxID=2040469 RepID=A0ABW5VC25_9FLAO|nr:DUF998 domain-containing protein [Arenibacter sp. H213]